MANFEVDSPSVLDEIHLLYVKAMFGDDTNKKVIRGGLKTKRPVRPYPVYDLVDETPYKRHEIMREYVSYLGRYAVQYKQPVSYIMQYTLVFDSQDPSCADVIQKLNRYLVSDKFNASMDKLNVSFFQLTPVREQNIPLEGFSDRQFIFQMKYDWADIWTDYDEDAAVESIDTVDVSETAIPEGA